MKKLCFIFTLTTLFLCSSLLLQAQVTPPNYQLPNGFSFTHPGVFSSQGDLDFIQSKANQNGHLMHTTYNELKSWTNNVDNYAAINTVTVKANNSHSSQKKLKNAADAVYSFALRWVVSGDNSWASAAVNIMNDWADTHTTIEVAQGEPQGHAVNVAAWIAIKFAAGAEILRHYNGGYSGFSASEQTDFEDYLVNVLFNYLDLDSVNKDRECSSNQINNSNYGCNYDCSPEYSKSDILYKSNNRIFARAAAMMAVGVFTNNETMLERGISWYKFGIPTYIFPDGLVEELQRDCGHSNMGLSELAQCAEMGRQQEINTFEEENSRLKLGFEWIAQANNGTSKTHCKGSTSCDGFPEDKIEYAGWEIAYNYYKTINGESMPHTQTF